MSTSYTEKFNVLEVFEQNPYQKIMMGARIDNPDDVVVINVFKKGPHIAPDFLEKAQNALHNIIHSEDTLQEQILVTDYQEGISLHNYLDGFGSDLDKRIALANDYMQKTFAYKNFSNYFLGIFLDDNQIILQEDTLLMNELIIVDEQIEQRHDFSKVVEKIASTLDLIFLGGKNVDMETEEKERIDAFLSSLNINHAVYKNLDDVYSAFKKTFILGEDMAEESPAAPPIIPVVDNNDSDTPEPEAPAPEPSIEDSIEVIEDEPEPELESEIESNRDKEIELDGLEVVNDIFDEDDEDYEKKSNSGAIAMILIAVAAIAAFFVFANPFAKEETKIPNASFIRQEIDGDVHFKNTSQAFGNDNEIVLSEWTVFATTSSGEKKLKNSNDTNLVLTIKNSGNYRVELKVQDKLEQWSDPASEAFSYSVDILSDVEEENNNNNTANPQEKLNKYDIELNGSGTEKVTDLYRSGSESIKMDLSAENGTITMKDLNMSDHSIVSMWMLSDGTTPVTIEMRGFKDGQMVFSKTVKHTPRAANIWEMVESKVDGSGANTLQLIFSGDSTIWVDDIDISTYK